MTVSCSGVTVTFSKGKQLSRTKKGGKSTGLEFWSKRPGKYGSGSIGKKITRRKERALNRLIEHKALKDIQ